MSCACGGLAHSLLSFTVSTMNALLPPMLRTSSTSLTYFACYGSSLASRSALRFASRYSTTTHEPPLANSPPVVLPEARHRSQTPQAAETTNLHQLKPAIKPRPRLRATKAAMTLVRFLDLPTGILYRELFLLRHPVLYPEFALC